VRGIFPSAVVGKQVGKRTLPLIVAALLLPALGACGGGSKPSGAAGNAVVKASGFRFEAPSAWTTSRTTTAVTVRRDRDTFVSATSFALLKPYSPTLFARAAKELDGIADKLAVQSHSRIAERKTISVAGEPVRAYRLTVKPVAGTPFDERIAFVLRGKREIQLLCHAPVGSGDPDGACALLYSTFSLSS
jgi:hypothetical protein